MSKSLLWFGKVISTSCTMMALTLLRAKSSSFVQLIFAFLGNPDTVCLGSTKFLCLRWTIDQVDLLKMPQKLVSVIDMTFLYDAQYSILLLRPKNDLKLSTQSADQWICMGK